MRFRRHRLFGPPCFASRDTIKKSTPLRGGRCGWEWGFIARPLLNPNGNYVLLRRFGAKEERRRLNSSPYLFEQLPCEFVAFENHVNFIHRPRGRLTRLEALGLSAVLNSSCLDTYFRVSNGNTQVSATEIRDMPLPEIDEIRKIGEFIESCGHMGAEDYLEGRAA
jgi:adenine-specific DNA-methyltransferase